MGSVDYSRVNDMRAGYGYKGIPDKFADEKAPKDAGVWKVDLETGESRLIVSLADAVAIANPYDPDFAQAKHWFNHLLVSPDGKKVIVDSAHSGQRQLYMLDISDIAK